MCISRKNIAVRDGDLHRRIKLLAIKINGDMEDVLRLAVPLLESQVTGTRGATAGDVGTTQRIAE